MLSINTFFFYLKSFCLITYFKVLKFCRLCVRPCMWEGVTEPQTISDIHIFMCVSLLYCFFALFHTYKLLQELNLGNGHWS